MEQRTLEITNISGKDLNKVNLISKMDVYAVVSISGDNSNQRFKTPVDKDCGTNPTWNFIVKFDMKEEAVQQNRLSLVLKLKCERVLGDKEIGEVHVPIKGLVDSNGSFNTKKLVSYQVLKPDGKPKGMVSFSYQFLGHANKVDEPVMAYPPPNLVGNNSYPPPPVEASAGAGKYPPPPRKEVYYPQQPAQVLAQVVPVAGYGPPPQYAVYPQQQAYDGYPTQQPGGGYGYPPPQQGYGYPPPQQGYGYPTVVDTPKRSNNLGLGLGVGLIGGALGGMLLEDVIEDVAGGNKYGDGYDEGFNDANNYDGGYDGGFDDGYDGGYDDGYDGEFDNGGYDGGYDDGGF